MIKAYILITLDMGKTEEVLSEIKKIKNLDSIAIVTGPFDVIIRVKVNKLDDLYDLTYSTLSKIDGINELTTHIVEKELIPEEG
jgi:DNA-binding Lrp family transcriptional regulator